MRRNCRTEGILRATFVNALLVVLAFGLVSAGCGGGGGTTDAASGTTDFGGPTGATGPSNTTASNAIQDAFDRYTRTYSLPPQVPNDCETTSQGLEAFDRLHGGVLVGSLLEYLSRGKVERSAGEVLTFLGVGFYTASCRAAVQGQIDSRLPP
jgi:hypothetical protein